MCDVCAGRPLPGSSRTSTQHPPRGVRARGHVYWPASCLAAPQRRTRPWSRGSCAKALPASANRSPSASPRPPQPPSRRSPQPAPHPCLSRSRVRSAAASGRRRAPPTPRPASPPASFCAHVDRGACGAECASCAARSRRPGCARGRCGSERPDRGQPPGGSWPLWRAAAAGAGGPPFAARSPPALQPRSPPRRPSQPPPPLRRALQPPRPPRRRVRPRPPRRRPLRRRQ
mmetsp:Transcript_24524/g.62095  ORF Transcript_24524/g.62095 Transcript_24524/m.62095 type:complete len:230 (-) Transcript_24524:639-1328(-)